MQSVLIVKSCPDMPEQNGGGLFLICGLRGLLLVL